MKNSKIPDDTGKGMTISQIAATTRMAKAYVEGLVVGRADRSLSIWPCILLR